MMKIELQGLKELERNLDKLTPAAGKGVLRRSLKKAAQPMADRMKDLAPRGETATDQLAESITISTRLSKRQAAQHRKAFKDDRASVEMFVGPGPDPAAWNQEYGNVNHGPQPFARPAFDQEVKPTLNRLAGIMSEEIDKAVKRAARKAARQRG